MKQRFEYAIVWLLLRGIGALPRPLARAVGVGIGNLAYLMVPRLRRVGMRNLALAFPGQSDRERTRILRGVYRGLGRQLAEFCLFPGYTRADLEKLVIYDGLENYLAAKERGKGVLFLTAHLSAWELSSFAHSLFGHPMTILVRELDNPYVNSLVERYRTRHGNRTVDKDNFARVLVSALKANETVGILADTNMTPPQGVFVEFFGVPACTAVGLARVAMRTGAAVLPAFMVWDENPRRYRIVFEPAITLIRTGNTEEDAVANTREFTRVIERYVRQYPEQWLWLHRRWKTRPPGEPPIY